jgi:non-ribosomal peptide synthetase component F
MAHAASNQGMPDWIDPLLLLDDQKVLEGQPETNPEPEALGLTARHLAYVIYTSGSAGVLKGVMVPHGGRRI